MNTYFSESKKWQQHCYYAQFFSGSITMASADAIPIIQKTIHTWWGDLYSKEEGCESVKEMSAIMNEPGMQIHSHFFRTYFSV